jgi:hypothetical protein
MEPSRFLPAFAEGATVAPAALQADPRANRLSASLVAARRELKSQ